MKLVGWLEISDMIDDYQYGDNYFNITDEIIHTTIMKKAKSQLEHYRKKSSNECTTKFLITLFDT